MVDTNDVDTYLKTCNTQWAKVKNSVCRLYGAQVLDNVRTAV